MNRKRQIGPRIRCAVHGESAGVGAVGQNDAAGMPCAVADHIIHIEGASGCRPQVGDRIGAGAGRAALGGTVEV